MSPTSVERHDTHESANSKRTGLSVTQARTDEDDSVDGISRLFNLIGYIFARHDPGDPLPPAPFELVQWAEKTVYFASLGAVAQGTLQYLHEKRSGSSAAGGVGAVRARAESAKNSLVQVAHACLKGVTRFGGISALYFGTELAMGVYRNKRDYYNATCGGLVAGAFFGASLFQGSAPSRIKGMILGCALGGIIGFPAGMIQDSLVQSLPEEEAKDREYAIRQTMNIAMGKEVKAFQQNVHESQDDPVGAVIAKLETKLRKNAIDEKDRVEEKVKNKGWFKRFW